MRDVELRKARYVQWTSGTCTAIPIWGIRNEHGNGLYERALETVSNTHEDTEVIIMGRRYKLK